MAKTTTKKKPEAKKETNNVINVAPQKSELKLEDLVNAFNENKEIMTLAMKAEVKNLYRVDRVIEIQERANKYFDNTCTMQVKNDITYAAIARSVDVLEDSLELLEALTFDDFVSDEYVDIFKKFIPYETPQTTVASTFMDGIVFNIIRPYGERLESVRFSTIDGIKELEA